MKDGLLQLLNIINTQQKQSTTIPTPNIFGIFEDKNVLFKLNVGNNHLTVTVQEFLTRMAILLFLIPLLYGLAFEDLKHAILIFGIYAMVFMVLEVGAQSIQNKIDPSTIAQEVYSGDLFNAAMQDINNLINGHYLDNYFSKPMQSTFSTAITYGSTLLTDANATSQYTTLKQEYANYASSIDQAKAYINFKNTFSSSYTTMTLGDASWYQKVSYHDWVMNNYNNMLQYRVQYEQAKLTGIAEATIYQQQVKTTQTYNQYKPQSSNTVTSTSVSTAFPSSVGSASGAAEVATAALDAITQTDEVQAITDIFTSAEKSITISSDMGNFTNLLKEDQIYYTDIMQLPGDHVTSLPLTISVSGTTENVTMPIAKPDLSVYDQIVNIFNSTDTTSIDKLLNSDNGAILSRFLYSLLSAVQNNTISSNMNVSTDIASFTQSISRVVDYMETGMDWKEAMYRVLYENSGQDVTVDFPTWLATKLLSDGDLPQGYDLTNVTEDQVPELLAQASIPTMLTDSNGNDIQLSNSNDFNSSNVNNCSCNCDIGMGFVSILNKGDIIAC